MSKNLTRKGLALGAIIALGSTVIAGTPALAIDPVSLAPTTGTGYTTILGETFSLSSQFTDAAQIAGEKLKWSITDASAKLDLTDIKVNTVLATNVALDTNKKFVISGGDNYSADVLTFHAVSTNTTDAFDVSVQAWMDFDDDGVIDSGEATSTAQTVKFVTAANSGLTTTLGVVSVYSSTLSAKINFGADVNIAQINPSHFSLAFGKLSNAGVAETIPGTGLGTYTGGVASAGEALTYDTTDKIFKLDVASATTSPVTAGIFVAQALDASGKPLGASSFKTAVAGVVTGLTAAKPAVGDNIALTSGSVATDNYGFDVRSGTKTVAIEAAATKTVDGDATVVAAGVPATVSVVYTPAASDTATTITIGGKTLSSTTTTASFEATSSTTGKFAFDVVSSTGKATGVLAVTVTVPGTTANVVRVTTLTWKDATVNTVKDLVVGSNHRSVVKGATVSVDYLLTDNFGAVVTAEGYRVHATAPAAALDGTSVVTLNKYVPFVAGKATVSYTAAVAGTFSLAATVQKQGTDGNYATGTPSYGTISSAIKVLAAAQSASKITANAGSNTALETKAFVTGDSRVLGNALTVPTWTVTANNTITGDVTDEFGAAVYGAPVTVAAVGVLFEANGVYAKDSITVNSNDSGQYSVKVYSAKSGKTTFTVTSGAATKTVDITFAGGSIANIVAGGTTVAIPTSSQAGRSVDLTATIVDKFGNPVSGVNVTFAVTGVGTLSDADGVVATNDKGVATVKLTAQYAEFGESSVTVSHKGADDASGTTATDADNFSVVKNVAFGVTDASIDLLGKRVIVTSEFAKGKKVTVYDNGVRKYSAIQTSDAERIIAWNVKKGSHNIVVKISGGYSDNLVLSVK